MVVESYIAWALDTKRKLAQLSPPPEAASCTEYGHIAILTQVLFKNFKIAYKSLTEIFDCEISFTLFLGSKVQCIYVFLCITTQ